MMNNFFSGVAKSSFIFEYETQSNSPKKYSRNCMDDCIASMSILLITDDFLKEVPILFGVNELSKEDILSSKFDSQTDFVKSSFNSTGRNLMEHKILEPYFINNRTKLHFKNSQSAKQKKSFSDILHLHRQ